MASSTAGPTDSQPNDKGKAKEVAGPSGKYESKTAGINPDATLPAAATAAANTQASSANSEESWQTMLTDTFEKQNRLLADINDSTKKSATYAGMG